MVRPACWSASAPTATRPRMWDEFKTAFHVQKLRAGDPRVAYAEAYAAALLNNRDHRQENLGPGHRAASKPARAPTWCWWTTFRPRRSPATTSSATLLFGIANAPVDSLMVNGRFVMRDRQLRSPWTSAPSPKKPRPAHANYGEDSDARTTPETDTGSARPTQKCCIPRRCLPRSGSRRWPRAPTSSTRSTCSTSPGARRTIQIRHVVLPKELTGVEANIVVLVGRDFPSGSHKVGPGLRHADGRRTGGRDPPGREHHHRPLDRQLRHRRGLYLASSRATPPSSSCRSR